MRANLKFQGSSWIFLGLLFGYSTASTIVTSDGDLEPTTTPGLDRNENACQPEVPGK